MLLKNHEREIHKLYKKTNGSIRRARESTAKINLRVRFPLMIAEYTTRWASPSTVSYAGQNSSIRTETELMEWVSALQWARGQEEQAIRVGPQFDPKYLKEFLKKSEKLKKDAAIKKREMEIKREEEKLARKAKKEKEQEEWWRQYLHPPTIYRI